MLPVPPTISQQANIIGLALQPWVEAQEGNLALMANQRHLWEYVYNQQTTKPQVLVCYMGETSRGGFALRNNLHRVDRDWWVVVMRGHGFKNEIGELGANAQTHLDAMEEVRDKIRVILNISEENPIDYKSMKPLANVAPGREANVFLDCYVIEFSTANDIPAVVTQNPNQQAQEEE